MLNLTKSERNIIIFLAVAGIIGSVLIMYKNYTKRVKLEVSTFEVESSSLKDIEYEIRQNKIVDINKGTVDDFEKLKGIGPTLAERIVEYRQKNGQFKKIEDIQNVEGIGPKKFENIKEFLKIE